MVDSCGQFVTLRSQPRLALVAPTVERGFLTLRAPSAEPTAVKLATVMAAAKTVRSKCVLSTALEEWEKLRDSVTQKHSTTG